MNRSTVLSLTSLCYGVEMLLEPCSAEVLSIPKPVLPICLISYASYVLILPEVPDAVHHLESDRTHPSYSS